MTYGIFVFFPLCFTSLRDQRNIAAFHDNQILRVDEIRLKLY